jgi:hypothetical protein
VSLMEGASLSGKALLNERVVLLHHDSSESWLIELKGKNLCAIDSLPKEEWQETAKRWLLAEAAKNEIHRLLFSGTIVSEQLKPLLKKRLSKVQVEALVVLPWTDTANVTEPQTIYAVSVALAAKAFLLRDPRFHPVPRLAYSLHRTSIIFEPSIAGIAIIVIALLVGGGLAVHHIQQVREVHQLRTRTARLEALTKGQADVQNLYTTLERERGMTRRGQAALDSLVATTEPLSPVLDTLCKRGRRIGDFWLTDFEWSQDETKIAGVALRRERIDEVARILSGARLTSVTTRNLGGRTVYSFMLTVSDSMAEKHS